MLSDLIAAAGDIRLLRGDLQRGLGFDQVQDHPVDQLDLEPGRFADLIEDGLPSSAPAAGGNGPRHRRPFRFLRLRHLRLRV